ncbi:hypothetical protein TWF132_000861 [Orbilia oligospora]|nr:hypothetical protein TWF132_000861 [Orbilia oligospora]
MGRGNRKLPWSPDEVAIRFQSTATGGTKDADEVHPGVTNLNLNGKGENQDRRVVGWLYQIKVTGKACYFLCRLADRALGLKFNNVLGEEWKYSTDIGTEHLKTLYLQRSRFQQIPQGSRWYKINGPHPLNYLSFQVTANNVVSSSRARMFGYSTLEIEYFICGVVEPWFENLGSKHSEWSSETNHDT